MTPRKKRSKAQGASELESIPLASVKRKRRSKYHNLMQEVLKGLVRLSPESALKIPLGTSSAKDMRSAVSRAAAAQKIGILSTSDGVYLYVWKKKP